MNVVKKVIPDTDPGDYGAAQPAPGWMFRAQPSSVTPHTGVTGADGAVSFATKTSTSQDVTLTEDEQDGYQHVVAPNDRNADCTTPERTSNWPVTDAASGPGSQPSRRNRA